MLVPTWTHICVSLTLFIFQSTEITSNPSPSTTGGPPPTSAPANQTASGANTTAPGGTKPQPENAQHRAATPKARYMVPRKLPLMDFTLPQTYAGLIEVSDTPGKMDQLFFWYVPTQNRAGLKDLTLWSNGGPGCSSLIGAFQENGPLKWDLGQKSAKLNPNSWHTQSNMLYLEHPANVGYSRGNIVINNEDQVARYFFRFLQKFLEIFPEMRGANLYLTGESYAGLYVTYAAQYIYQHQAHLALHLQGILLVDAVISIDAFHFNAPVLRFIKKWHDKYLQKISAKAIAEIAKLDAYCGASKYIVENLKYPSSEFHDAGKLTSDPKCAIWPLMEAALPKSFNVYNIAKQENLTDIMVQSPSYFDRPDVRRALNAEKGTSEWNACSSSPNIFPNGDGSLVPVASALPYVIEKSKRTVILHGELDGLLLLEGSILAVQDFKWNNKFGFDHPINRTFMVGSRRKGLYQSERGLTFIQVENAGHMIPQDQPEAALSAFEYLLGRRQKV